MGKGKHTFVDRESGSASAPGASPATQLGGKLPLQEPPFPAHLLFSQSWLLGPALIEQGVRFQCPQSRLRPVSP